MIVCIVIESKLTLELVWKVNMILLKRIQIDMLKDTKLFLCVFSTVKEENDVQITDAIGREGLHSDNVPS